jgi:membrane-associated phospholipid phosphatase
MLNYLKLMILSTGAGLIYGSMLYYLHQKKLGFLIRFIILIICSLVLQLEVHHLIMMLITFLLGMWVAIIWALRMRKKDEHTNKYF